MKNIQWDTLRFIGAINDANPCPIPKNNDSFTAYYKGIAIRLCAIDVSNNGLIKAKVECPDHEADELPEGLDIGDTVEIDNNFISWRHL